MLLIQLPQDAIDNLNEQAGLGANARFTVDVETQTLTAPDGNTYKFDLDPFRKHCLLNGLDEIALTLEKGDNIKTYETNAQSWLTPAG